MWEISKFFTNKTKQDYYRQKRENDKHLKNPFGTLKQLPDTRKKSNGRAKIKSKDRILTENIQQITDIFNKCFYNLGSNFFKRLLLQATHIQKYLFL